MTSRPAVSTRCSGGDEYTFPFPVADPPAFAWKFDRTHFDPSRLAVDPTSGRVACASQLTVGRVAIVQPENFALQIEEANIKNLESLPVIKKSEYVEIPLKFASARGVAWIAPEFSEDGVTTTLVVSDSNASVVRVIDIPPDAPNSFDSSGKEITERFHIGVQERSGRGGDCLYYPQDVDTYIDPTTGEPRILIADGANHRLQIFNLNQQLVHSIKFGNVRTESSLDSWVWSLAVDRENHQLLVVFQKMPAMLFDLREAEPNEIGRLTPCGTNNSNACFDELGNILFTNGDDSIFVFDLEGTLQASVPFGEKIVITGFDIDHVRQRFFVSFSSGLVCGYRLATLTKSANKR